MAVVWERSSETIVVTAEGATKHLCIVSPMFFHLTGVPLDQITQSDEPLALVFEIPSTRYKNKKRKNRANNNEGAGCDDTVAEDDDDAFLRSTDLDDGDFGYDSASTLLGRAYCVRLNNDVELFPQNETIKPLPIPPSMRPGLLTLAELLEAAWGQENGEEGGPPKSISTSPVADGEENDDASQRPVTLVRDFVR